MWTGGDSCSSMYFGYKYESGLSDILRYEMWSFVCEQSFLLNYNAKKVFL